MADDLDEQIRAAMKTLDAEVPSGYFEALPNQTLARLEGSSMQHGSSGTTENRDNVAAPPMMDAVEGEPVATQAKPIMDQDRDEDSGLHDIRNLAQSTKQRLSKSRMSTSPPIADDVLASASGSFKNIALPQPAKMVSLPSVDELPSKAEVLAAEKAAKDAAKKAAKEAKVESRPEAAKVEAVAAVAPVEAKPVHAAAARQAFKLPSQQKSSKGPILALVGLGVAAAAGGVIYLQTTKQESAKVASVPAAESAAAPAGAGSAQMITAQPIPEPAPAAAAAPVEPPKTEEPAQIATEAPKDSDADAKKHAKATKSAPKAKVEKTDTKTEVPAEKADAKKPAAKDAKPSGDEGEPSFDALLKEAGVSDQKKETKPKLDKKSLTGDDFKHGMGAVEGKAKSCYKGTQGTALVKLTVAPSGQISKMAVAGDFAGKPEASCIQAALKGATFPPWDGGPQSFTYAVLLSD